MKRTDEHRGEDLDVICYHIACQLHTLVGKGCRPLPLMEFVHLLAKFKSVRVHQMKEVNARKKELSRLGQRLEAIASDLEKLGTRPTNSSNAQVGSPLAVATAAPPLAGGTLRAYASVLKEKRAKIAKEWSVRRAFPLVPLLCLYCKETSGGSITNRELADLLNWTSLLNDPNGPEVTYHEHHVAMMQCRFRKKPDYLSWCKLMEHWLAECPDGEFSFLEWVTKCKTGVLEPCDALEPIRKMLRKANRAVPTQKREAIKALTR
jgi:hypothetical protein